MGNEKETMKLGEHGRIFARAVKMLFSLNRAYLWCTIWKAFLSSVIPYVPIYFSAKLLDAILTGARVETVAWYAGLTVGLAFLLNLLLTWVTVAREVEEDKLYRERDWMFSEKQMGMEYSSMENRESALLLARIREESNSGYNLFFLYYGMERCIRSMTGIVFSASMMVSFFTLRTIGIYTKLGVVAGIVLTVLSGIFVTSQESKINVMFYHKNVTMNVLSGKYRSVLQSDSVGMDVRLYGMGKKIEEGRAAAETEYYKNCMERNKKCICFSVPGVVLTHLLKFGVYIVLIAAALSGAVSVGSIAKYVACIMLLLEAVSGLVGAVQRLCSNNYYLKRFFSYCDIPNNMYQGSLTVEKRLDNEYYVEFRDVSFRYPNTDSYALRHVNVKFQVGKKLAIVGKNGSGKTTFIKLLCRLYDPTEGEILLNGVNIKKYDYDEYMSIFSVVFQDFQLFSFTIGQNVAAAKEYDEERVIDCLERAGFGGRLETMPAGVQTYLYRDYAADGVEISGGEAQKIALARALYKDAPFLVLDEPTAALDPVSEYEVYRKFNELSGERTAVYISHRLASCRFCDSIVVFEKGCVVQHGSHEALVADTGGKYYELWNAQAQYYVDAPQVQALPH